MRKTKRLISEVATAFAAEVKGRFPGSTPEVIYDSFDGFDVWVRIKAPPELEDDVQEFISELFGRFGLDTGVLVLGTFRPKAAEAALGGSRE